MGAALAWLAAATLILAGSHAAAADARAAVEAFLARLGDVVLTDLVIHQTLTLYDPDGRHPQSTGEQRLYLKLPRRQRLETTIEGRREVRLTVGERVWIRRPDGRTYEAPPDVPGAGRTDLLVPFRRSADDLLAEWRGLGVRAEVAHAARVAGRAVTVIGARPGERDVPAVWLDPEHGVIRFVTRETLPTGPALVDRAFSEHRPLIGSFFFPRRLEVFRDGKLLLLFTVRSAVANTNPPDALFDPEALARER